MTNDPPRPPRGVTLIPLDADPEDTHNALVRALGERLIETSAFKIRVVHIYPPIPTRAWDWCAYFDADPEGSPYGWGPTRQAAIDDLLALLTEDE